MEEKQVVLSAGTLSYLDHGSGPTMLFLHGGVITSRAHIPLFELLGRHFHVIAPTHPGHGRSFGITQRWNPEDFIRVYREFFHTIGVFPEYIVGHSFGGFLALLLAVEGIGKKVFVFASVGAPPSLTPTRYIRAQLREAQEIFFRWKDVRQMYIWFSTVKSALSTVVYHPQTLLWFSQHNASFDIRQKLTRIRVPITFFWGAEDQTISSSAGRTMAECIPGARFIVFPGKRHLYCITDPIFTYHELMKVL